MFVSSDKKRVTVIGVGVGVNTLTTEALDAILMSDVVVGAPSLLELFTDLPKPSFPYYLPNDVAALIESEVAMEFVVLVSGDVGFFSAAAGLADALCAYDLCFVPGISTVSAFFAKLKLPWHDTAFVSAHGREINIIDAVRRNRLVYCLTGGNVNELGARLVDVGYGYIKTHVGENLGRVSERIYETTAGSLARGDFPSLTVLLFINDAFDDSIPTGLPDSYFSRISGIPMTKSETRAVVLSKLRLRPTDICWDVGAGTGSVTVEMALSAYSGHVYAVERREDAVDLIGQNCSRFHLGNVTAIRGDAPDALMTLPPPDAVFIGGSGGEVDSIITVVLQKNPMARIVVTAVTLETASSAQDALAKAGLEPDILQLNVSVGKKVGGSHLMEARNPITILFAGGKA